MSPGLPEEAQDVLQHRPVARPQHVRCLRDHAAQSRARIFETAPSIETAKDISLARVGTPRCEKTAPSGWDSALVADDEAAIDRRAVPVERIGMAAEAFLRLVERDIAGLRQEPGGGQAGNAAADDGHPQGTGGRRMGQGGSPVPGLRAADRSGSG